MGSPGLRTIAEHVERTLALVTPLPAVELPLTDVVAAALPLVLAEDVTAAHAVPPFDASAMDGYAVRLADLPDDGSPVLLRVVGEVAAAPVPAVAEIGSSGTGSGVPAQDFAPELTISRGEAVRIMTGAPLPRGADAVVPVERTSTGRFVAGAPGTERTVTLGRTGRSNVRHQGEDVLPGAPVARAGAEVTAAVVAALAASGAATVRVHRRPRVAVVATGSELVPAGTPLLPGQIVDSNSLMLAAAARAAGADVVRLGPVPDTRDALGAALDRAVTPAPAAECPGFVVAGAEKLQIRGTQRRAVADGGGGVDLVVTAGGVSAGAADVVREVLAAGGPATDVDVAGVGMQPGRPQALARWRGVPWVAVPGNPVSAYVSFVLFAAPAIARLRGAPAGSAGPRSEMRTAAVGWASPPGKEQVLPVRVLASGDVEPALVAASGSGGHLVSALAGSDGLALVAADVEKVDPGDRVRVLFA